MTDSQPPKPPIGHDSRVTMHFAITLADGTPVESSRGGEPLRFVIGDGTLVQGLEFALFGLHAGDQQRLRIGPKDAYGMHDPARLHVIPLRDFPLDMEPEAGQVIGFTTPDGDEIPGTVISVDEQQVRVDFNHPLAGREIIFEVEILAVEPG